MRGLACAIAVLAGCQPAGAGADPKPEPEPPQAEWFERDMLVRFHMHENFDLLRAIEKLFVRGKLEDGRVFARAIAEAPEEPGLDSFAKRATDVRARAAEVAAATTIDDALRREARLAQACADCHVDAGVLPDFDHPPRLPADRGTVTTRMARHLWATDRLWEGMVGNSDEAWRAGLDVLASAPLPSSELGGERAAIAHRLQQLADAARKAQATDQLRDKAREYGDILVTCAACHRTPATHTATD